MFSYRVLTTFNSNPANKNLFLFTTINKKDYFIQSIICLILYTDGKSYLKLKPHVLHHFDMNVHGLWQSIKQQQGVFFYLPNTVTHMWSIAVRADIHEMRLLFVLYFYFLLLPLFFYKWKVIVPSCLSLNPPLPVCVCAHCRLVPGVKSAR